MKASPKFLWLTAFALLLALACGLSLYLGFFLWNTTAHAGLILTVYLGWGLSLLLTSVAGSRAIAWFLFPSRASFQVVSRDRPSDQDDDSGGARKKSVPVVQVSTLVHSLMVVALMLGFAFAANRLSDNALFSTQRVLLDALSRSDDAEDLLSLFRQTEEMLTQEDVVHFTKLLPTYFDHRDPVVAQAAMKTASVMARRMNLSVAALLKQKVLLGDRWEPKLLLWFRSELAPQLRERFAQGEAPMLETLEALVWIADQVDLPLYLRIVHSPQTPPAMLELAAFGLGNMGTMEAGEGLLHLLRRSPDAPEPVVFHGLNNIAAGLRNDPGDPLTLDAKVLEFGQKLVELTKEASSQRLCLLVQTISLLQHQGLTQPLITLFESPQSDFLCPRLEFQPPGGNPDLLVPAKNLRVVLANALADMAVGNDLLQKWLPGALSNPALAGDGLEALKALKTLLDR